MSRGCVPALPPLSERGESLAWLINKARSKSGVFFPRYIGGICVWLFLFRALRWWWFGCNLVSLLVPDSGVFAQGFLKGPLNVAPVLPAAGGAGQHPNAAYCPPCTGLPPPPHEG